MLTLGTLSHLNNILIFRIFKILSKHAEKLYKPAASFT